MERLKRHMKFIGLAGLLLILLAGCTISRDYGPYKGKVVDAETNEPIEGAVVFVRFYTDAYGSLGGPSPKFADSIEVLTDAKGEFNIPKYKVKTFRLLNTWDSFERVVIFKPGYGAFPEHPESGRDHHEAKHIILQDSYVTVTLPKLNTIYERKRNLGYASYNRSYIPNEKQKIILSLLNQEAQEINLEPIGINKERK